MIDWQPLETMPPRTPIILYFPVTGRVEAAWAFTDAQGLPVYTLFGEAWDGQASHWAPLNLPEAAP